MLEVAVIALRWFQYTGAVVLLGLPMFLLYSFKGTDGSSLVRARPALILAASVVALGSVLALVAQTAVMAGSLGEALKPASLSFMVTGTALGLAIVVRTVTALACLIAIVVMRPGRALWGVAVAAGLVVTASFAWTGHGAATEGPGGLVHLGADILHAIAAAIWLGALAALTIMLLRLTGPLNPALHHALHSFAGLGTFAVLMLLLTGLVNSWFLIGPAQVGTLGTSLYGQFLIGKLILFGLMLALAAGNRFSLTPALGEILGRGGDPRQALQRLRRSVVAETLVGAVLLGLVAIMGTLAPPSAM